MLSMANPRRGLLSVPLCSMSSSGASGSPAAAHSEATAGFIQNWVVSCGHREGTVAGS